MASTLILFVDNVPFIYEHKPFITDLVVNTLDCMGMVSKYIRLRTGRSSILLRNKEASTTLYAIRRWGRQNNFENWNLTEEQVLKISYFYKYPRIKILWFISSMWKSFQKKQYYLFMDYHHYHCWVDFVELRETRWSKPCLVFTIWSDSNMEHLELFAELSVTEIKTTEKGGNLARLSFLFHYFTMLVYKKWPNDTQLGQLTGSNDL